LARFDAVGGVHPIGLTDVEKHGVDDHGFWIMRTFEINDNEWFPPAALYKSIFHDGPE
jgi:hypothetical protein